MRLAVSLLLALLALPAGAQHPTRWLATWSTANHAATAAPPRDPTQPDRSLPAYDSGDHLHPSDAGYKAMGEAIDLTLFRRTRQ